MKTVAVTQFNQPKPRRADFNLTEEFLQYKRQIIAKIQ